MQKTTTDYENFILEFVALILDILENGTFISKLQQRDVEFIEKIHLYEDIDNIKISEKTRSRIDFQLLEACKRYIEAQIRDGAGHDITSANDLIENHYNLSREYYAKKYNKDIPELLVNLKELCKNHLTVIDLASNRIQTQQQYDLINKNISNLEESVENRIEEINIAINEQAKAASDTMEAVSRKVENEESKIYRDIVTIISIFSAIILTVAGTFSFSTAALESIAATNIYCLIIIVAILGIVLMAVLTGLYYFLFGVRHSKVEDFGWKYKIKLLIPVIVADVLLFGLIVIILFTRKGELELELVEQQQNAVNYIMYRTLES